MYLSASTFIATPSASPPFLTGSSTTELAAVDAIPSNKRACKQFNNPRIPCSQMGIEVFILLPKGFVFFIARPMKGLSTTVSVLLFREHASTNVDRASKLLVLQRTKIVGL
jgi:hypothetical protein